MGYLDHIRACNAHDPKALVAFAVDGIRIGLTPGDIAEYLADRGDGFLLRDRVLTLADHIRDADDRTQCVDRAIRDLHARGQFAYWHDEAFPVAASFAAPPLFVMERSGVPMLGVPAYGVHLNGYVRTPDGLAVWVAKRAQQDRLFPGQLDQIVAGGHAAGFALRETVIKEAWEEAAIPESLSRTARPVSSISYVMSLWGGLRNDTLFIYDLELPADFVPRNTDGEVAGFTLMPVHEVAAIVRNGFDFKFNCALVVIDFLIRHGILDPDREPDYHALIKGLRGGSAVIDLGTEPMVRSAAAL